MFIQIVVGSERMIRQLIEHGADVNVVNTHKNTALLLAINKGKSY